ncbi:hypothetical protein M8494_36545 [Serratia ureilytica]
MMAMEPLSKSKAKGFLDRLDGWNSAISVYTDCMGLTPQGCARAAERAKAAVGQRYPYSLLDFNCHRFTFAALPAIRALISGLPDTSILSERGPMARMATMKASRCRQRVTGQENRLIRLTMALFYGQDNICSLHHPAVDVSPGPARTSLNWPLCWNPLALTSGDSLPL